MERPDRTTLIGLELTNEIIFLSRERKAAISAHSKNIERINSRIRALEKSLDSLKDD